MIPTTAKTHPLELKRLSFGQLSVDVLEIDGELYFYAPSLARTLEYASAKDMLRGVPEAEKRKFKVSTNAIKGGVLDAPPLEAETEDADPKGGASNAPPLEQKNGALNLQEANFLTEPGFYRVVFRSRSPVAEPFVCWVAYDVLPSIRKTGQYQIHRVADELKLKLAFTPAQWAWLRERPSFVDIIPLALAGYNGVEISRKLGYNTKGITARKQIAKLKALGFLPQKIKPRAQQLEEQIFAELAEAKALQALPQT